MEMEKKHIALMVRVGLRHALGIRAAKRRGKMRLGMQRLKNFLTHPMKSELKWKLEISEVRETPLLVAINSEGIGLVALKDNQSEYIRHSFD